MGLIWCSLTSMTISIKKVRYFIAAADAGQVSQAAIELNVSQSAVTAAIKQLEDDLGVRLFDRIGDAQIELVRTRVSAGSPDVTHLDFNVSN